MKPFPKDFLWGASTAAYQVEGGLTTQWSEWEQRRAEWLAHEVPRRFHWFPHAERLKGKWDDPQNYIAGNGVEHYQRYKTDFDLLGELNMNAFRFGIEWARLEPEEGKWDETAVEHYRAYIAELKARGIEPVLTLWHWTMPTWFVAKGAFEKRANLQFFDRYVQKVVDEFGAELRYVLTLNEPNVYTLFGYGSGDWPPEKKRPLLLFRVYQNLVHAHRRAYRIIKATHPAITVGLPMNLGFIRAKSPRNPCNRLTVKLLSYSWNWWFLNRIRGQLDILGVNFYFAEYRDTFGRIKNPKRPVNDLGWYMEPAAIENLLAEVHHRYHMPLLITENGLADGQDEYRKWWIEETLGAVKRSVQAGIPLLGYLHWSLLDNFEWAYGWWPKFGLVAVDRRTMKRTIRPSAKWFAAYIEKARHG